MVVKQNWLIAGGSGLIGKALVTHALNQGNEITIISRTPKKFMKHFAAAVKWVSWQDLEVSHFKKADVCLNLAGHSIACLWHQSNKSKIYNSRINTTIKLAEMIASLPKNEAPHFICASGLSIYGPQHCLQNNSYDEWSELPVKPDWLGQLAMSWEAASHKLMDLNYPVTHLRLAPVFTIKGGIFKQLLIPLKLGLAGKIGNGNQPFSWVSLTDVVRAIDWIIQHQNHGPINLVSPSMTSQFKTYQMMAKHFKRPCLFHLPEKFIKLIFAEMGTNLLLSGQHVSPKFLLEQGFKFKHNEINDFLCSKT